MPTLKQLDNNFVARLTALLIVPYGNEPEKAASAFKAFVSDGKINISSLSSYRLVDISTALEAVSSYLLSKNNAELAGRVIPEQYAASYNMAFFIEMLRLDYLKGLPYPPELIEVYDRLKNNQAVTVGDLLTEIEAALKTGSRLTTYSRLTSKLQNAIFEYYFTRVSPKNPTDALTSFKDLMAELGIDKIAAVRIRDGLLLVPAAADLLKGAVDTGASKSARVRLGNSDDAAVISFVLLYRIIQGSGLVISQGDRVYRLPRQLTNAQANAIRGNLADSDLTFGDVMNIWYGGIAQFQAENHFNLTTAEKGVALTALFVLGYFSLFHDRS
jgi:hypothetical protein